MWVVVGQLLEQVGSEGITDYDVGKGTGWEGWQRLRLSIRVSGVSIGAAVSCGGWMGLSGTWVARHGGNEVVDWCEVL